MSDNFAITHVAYSDAPTLTRVILLTNNPCHLYAYKAGKPPVLTTHWRAVRGLPLRCVPKWRVLGAIVREQNEAGDTLIHTIDTPGWRAAQGYWLIVLGTMAGNPSPSIGPILEHANDGGKEYNFKRFPTSDGDFPTHFTKFPPGNKNWECVDEDPPDENASYLRSSQTLGPFPQAGGGAFMRYDPVPAPQKYFLIKRIEFWSRLKKDNYGWPWICDNPWPSYAAMYKLNTGQLFWLPPQVVTGWQSWSNYYDHQEFNPWTADYWFYPALDDIQVGLQMRQPCQHSIRTSTYCTQFYFNIEYWDEAEEVWP